MFFNNVYITAEGYDLLGTATAGSNAKITWKNAITSSVDIRNWTLSEKNAATADDFPISEHTSSGAVTSAVHNQKDAVVDDQTIKVDVVTVTVNMNNKQYNGIANTLCIFARLEGDDTDKLVVIASADNPDTVHPLPEPYNALLDLYIELSGTAVSEVSANSSWYATASSFTNLANRVVTTHSENSTSTGEDQVIYGVKTFKNNVHTSNVTPLSNLDADLGDTAHRYKSVFARSINQSVIECSTEANANGKLITSRIAFTPISGDRILVKFNNGNSASAPTISINLGEVYHINGLRTDLPENAVVPMTFNGSSWDVDGVSSVAKQVDVSVKSEASEYSLVFTDVATIQLAGTPRNRELCIDPNTDVNLKYNPGTNTLSTSNLKCDNLEVGGDFNLNYSAVCDLANLMGVKLKYIYIYQATAVGGSELTFSTDDEVEFGMGGNKFNDRVTSSNYTISLTTPPRIMYATGTYIITKVISKGTTSSVADALINITTGDDTYTDCANPNYGTPCVCLAIKVS